MRRIAEISDRVGDLFNGDFYGYRREVLGWAASLLITHPLDEAERTIKECARVCLLEAFHLEAGGGGEVVMVALTKLTEYLWLLGCDLTQWFHTEPGLPQIRVGASLIEVELPSLV